MFDVMLLFIPVFTGWAIYFSMLAPAALDDGHRWRGDL